MVIFEDNELEAALVTYNRPLAVKVTLEKYAKEFIVRNIKLSIYDSSEENDTYDIVREFNRLNAEYVEYHRVDSSVGAGDKPIIALLGSKCKYIWVLADKRIASFYDLDKYIFPKVRDDDYMALILATENWIQRNSLPTEKEYDNLQKCLIETLPEQSWVGKTIYKKEIFDGYCFDEKLIEDIRNEFEDELPGYRFLALEILALSQKKSSFKAYMHMTNVDFYLDNSVKSWNSNYYRFMFGHWVVLLKYITKGLWNSENYIKNYFNSRESENCLFSEEALYFSRVTADLQEVYDEFLERGFFDYAPINQSLIHFYAKAPIEKVREHYLYEMRHDCLDSDLIMGIKLILPKIKETVKKIYIYGAGYGGKIVLEELEKENIHIAGFVDKQAKSIVKIRDISVYTLDEIDSSDSILIVSLKKIVDDVKSQCTSFGFEDNMFYLCDLVGR